MVSVILSKTFQALEGKKHNTAFGAFIFSVSLGSWVRVGPSRIFLICCTPDFTVVFFCPIVNHFIKVLDVWLSPSARRLVGLPQTSSFVPLPTGMRPRPPNFNVKRDETLILHFF